MKEVIEFDPQSESQVLSMMEAFPEAMAYLFMSHYKELQIVGLYTIVSGVTVFEDYNVKLTEGFIVPEA